MKTGTHTDRKQKNQGQHWISDPKRLSIYLRDGLACCWCGESIEQGAKLTLDHLTPYSLGGSNDATNLVTSCLRCNSSRGNRSVVKFAKACAIYLNHGILPITITAHIRKTAKRELDLSLAKQIIAQRGSWTAALKNPKL